MAAAAPGTNPNESKLADLLTRATTLFGTTATGSSSIDEFCALVQSEPEGPQITLRLLSHKLQSPVESEAMAALDVLQRCVETCGPAFHSEIGKFRFLNEIVKVISPKYFGVYTTSRVKDRCIEMMYGWTKTLKSEPKIQEAYDMLRKQGLLRIDPAAKELEAEAAKKAAEAEKQRLSAASAGSSVLGLPEVPKKAQPRKPILDDEKAKTLKLLLGSKRPEDLAAANQLIKESLKQDEERVERHTKRHAELEIVRNNMTLLTDMLDHYEESLMAQTPENRTPRNSTTDSDTDTDVMAELYMMLDKHRPSLFRMASEIEDTDDDMLAALLRANDELLEVLGRYRHLVNGEPMMMTPQPRSQQPSKAAKSKEQDKSGYLVDVADLMMAHEPVQNPGASRPAAVDFLSEELAAAGLGSSSNTGQSTQLDEAKTAFKEFSTTASSKPPDSELITLETAGANNASEVSVQKILDSISAQQKNSLMDTTDDSAMPLRRGGAQPKQLDALDLLGREVIERHLPEKAEKPKTASPNGSKEPPVPMSTSLLDSDDIPSSNTDNSEPPPKSSSNVEPPKSPAREPQQRQQQDNASPAPVEFKDLTFSLDRFKPLPSASPLPLYQRNGINVLLLLNSDSPLPNVKIFLVSSTSMAVDPISNYKISFYVHAKQANVCRIRPLEASATSLAAFNPIAAPAVVTQLILASFTAPYPEALKLRFEVSYRLRDTCYSESGIEEVPLFFESQ